MQNIYIIRRVPNQNCNLTGLVDQNIKIFVKGLEISLTMLRYCKLSIFFVPLESLSLDKIVRKVAGNIVVSNIALS